MYCRHRCVSDGDINATARDLATLQVDDDGATAKRNDVDAEKITSTKDNKKSNKNSSEPRVLISRMARKGKKCTFIQNLELFGK